MRLISNMPALRRLAIMPTYMCPSGPHSDGPANGLYRQRYIPVSRPFCKVEKNAKLTTVTAIFQSAPHVSFTRYAELLGRCKNMAQWKARTLAVGVPEEASLHVRSSLECLRLLAARFIFDTTPGEPLCSSMRDRDFFVDQEANDWLST